VLVAVLLLAGGPVGAQSLQHPSKVQIKPPAAAEDTLRIWGGLQAGPNGSIQVINEDGSIGSGLATPADGSVTFAQWATNSCLSGNIPQFNGTDWECGTVSGAGGLADTDNAVITGNWRFSTNTAFGNSIPGSAQQLLHAYKSTSAAGLRLEQGDASWWDLVSTAGNFTLGTSGATLLTVTPTGVGVSKTPTSALDVDGTVTATGLSLSGLVHSHLVPSSADTYDLGTYAAPWRTAHISELKAILFAEETASVMGGYLIIAPGAGSFAAAVSSVATVIDFGQVMTPGEWVLVKGLTTAGVASTEYILVNAWQSSGNLYAVTRDLAAAHSPDPAWPSGAAYAVLGASGDGRIELTASGVPKISILAQGATYGASTETLRLGALDGMPGIASGKVGMAIGDLTAAGLSYYDATLTVRGDIRATSGYFGNTANVVTVDSLGLSVGTTGAIRSGSTTYGSGTGFWMGYDAGAYKLRIGDLTNYMAWDGTQLVVRANALFGDGTGVTSISGSNIVTGSITAGQIAADSITSNELAAGSVTASEISAGSVSAFAIAAGTITTNEIAAGTIVASDIAAGTITGDRIAAGTITATNITASSLSAITANLGTVNIGTGGYLATTGVTFSSGTGIFLGYDSTAYKFRVGVPSGNRFTFGGSEIELVTGGVRIESNEGITLDSGSGSANMYKFNSSAVGMGYSSSELRLLGASTVRLTGGSTSWVVGSGNAYMSTGTKHLGRSSDLFTEFYANLPTTTSDMDVLVTDTSRTYRKTNGRTDTIRVSTSICPAGYRYLYFQAGLLTDSVCG
jgi:hypothetical protein